MKEISRRKLLQAGASLGIVGAIPQSMSTVAAESSPTLEKFVQPLPTLEEREPDGTRDGVDAYDIPVKEFTQNLHPDLPDTTLWGFDGVYPGPLITAERGEPIQVRFDNSFLPDTHLLEVDKRIGGTTPENYHYDGFDGPVPEVRTVTHFHGLEIEPESDGQADMWTSPGGAEGPRFSKEWQELPMGQARLTSTYHDHTVGITRLNAYVGLLGLYQITSQAERDLNLPSGEYDIPMLIQDRSFNDDGSLKYLDSWASSFLGDTAVVNGAVWPSLEVEPRRYRFRLANGANHRAFDLKLQSDSGSGAPMLYQFAPDHGYLDSVVSIGPDGDLDSLRIHTFERAEVIVDFTDYAGQTFTVTNEAQMGVGLEEIFQIKVSDPDTAPEDPSTAPSDLNLPSVGPTFNEDDVVETRNMDLGLEIKNDLPTYTLNGYTMWDDGSMVYPQLGSTEIWEFRNHTSGTHPMHMHLVKFKVIGRGPDGTDDPLPNERGHKDVVRVKPDEKVRVLTRFDGYTGQYPWHCHMLEHEDNKMMICFVVQDGEEEGPDPVVGDKSPTDPDDDGLYEDIDGDGSETYDDVVDLFENYDDPAVQNNPEAYDFNENGHLDFDDIVELFKEM